MRVRKIGTLVFDSNTNIIVDADAQDAPGVGFHINRLDDPQPFAVEIAFKRATRQQALEAVNALARELFSYAQRRQNNHLAIAGGAPVFIEDAAGGVTLLSYLRDSSVTLPGVETTATGVIARARVTGVLVSSFIDYSYATTSISLLKPYERRLVTLNSTSDAHLYKNSLKHVFSSMSGLYNALLAIETLESATATSRINVVNPTSVTYGITLESWNANWATLTRANFSSATNGTITYDVPAGLPKDAYRLFIEIFCPTTPAIGAVYNVAWDGQPTVYETISGDRSWYTPALISTEGVSFSVTLNVEGVPNGTLVMPLVLIPLDGVYVWNAVTPPTLSFFRVIARQRAGAAPLLAFPNGIVYGSPEFISGRYIAVFNGAMATNITSAAADLSIYSNRIEPAAFA